MRQRPEWMGRATYPNGPDELEMREVRVRVPPRGSRTRVLVLATTSTGPATRGTDLAQSYRQRWPVEVGLRNVRVTLGMDVLRCKSPALVRKEVWAHLLAYNRICTAMTQVAVASDRQPRELSVAYTVPARAAFAQVPDTEPGYQAFVSRVRAYPVGDRPDRCEPRAEATTQTISAAHGAQRPSPKAARPLSFGTQEVT
ncbi:hypothetical protein R5W24_006569, partial [Gemmata sp. JC717]|uniref:transposase n=1 Tax=Gemmata algarum TaxID=2975278 RepID=UPI0022923A49